MSRKLWFQFCIFFLLMFKKSQQANGVAGQFDGLREESVTQAHIDYMGQLEVNFLTVYSEPDKVLPWSDLRGDNSTTREKNLCALTWNEPDLPDYVRDCKSMRNLKETAMLLISINNRTYKMDTLSCDCRHRMYHINDMYKVQQPRRFYITPRSETEYYKFIIIDFKLRLVNLMIHLPFYYDISEQEFYYDYNA